MLTPDALESRLILFLGELLRSYGREAEITPERALFEDGLLDSVQFIELMSFVENELGQQVPDRLLNVKYFRTPRDIALTFAPLAA